MNTKYNPETIKTIVHQYNKGTPSLEVSTMNL